MIPNKNTMGEVNEIITDDETGYKRIIHAKFTIYIMRKI